jgi:hypothetical protein
LLWSKHFLSLQMISMGQRANFATRGSDPMLLGISPYGWMSLSVRLISTLALLYMVPDTDLRSQRQTKTYALLHLQGQHCSNCLIQHSVWMPCRFADTVPYGQNFIPAMVRAGIVDDAVIASSAFNSGLIYQTGNLLTDTPSWSPWLSRASPEHRNRRRKTSQNTCESSKSVNI